MIGMLRFIPKQGSRVAFQRISPALQSARWYRGDSGDMKSRENLDPNDEVAKRESKLIDIAKPKSEKIYARHIAMPTLEGIDAHALGIGQDEEVKNSPDANKELELDIRRKRLVYRSKQRGWLEVDLLLGTWASEHVHLLDMEELDEFEDFVNLETVDIYNIVTLRTNVPDELKGGREVVERIQNWAKQSPLGKADPKKYGEVKGKNNLI